MVKTKVELREKLADYIKENGETDTKDLSNYSRKIAPNIYTSGYTTTQMLKQIKTIEKKEDKWRTRPLL